MKERSKRDDRGPPTGSRTGPRARATQDRKYGDPYQRAARPPSDAPPRERLSAPAAGSVRLDPDVARVFSDPAAVNEVLRMVIRMARLVGGRPASPARDRPTGPPRDRPPSFRERGQGGPPRRESRGDRPAASVPRRPRFENK